MSLISLGNLFDPQKLQESKSGFSFLKLILVGIGFPKTIPFVQLLFEFPLDLNKGGSKSCLSWENTKNPWKNPGKIPNPFWTRKQLRKSL